MSDEVEAQVEEGTELNYETASAYLSLEDNIAWKDYNAVVQALLDQCNLVLWGARETADLHRAQGAAEALRMLNSRVVYANEIARKPHVVETS